VYTYDWNKTPEENAGAYARVDMAHQTAGRFPANSAYLTSDIVYQPSENGGYTYTPVDPQTAALALGHDLNVQAQGKDWALQDQANKQGYDKTLNDFIGQGKIVKNGQSYYYTASTQQGLNAIHSSFAAAAEQNAQAAYKNLNDNYQRRLYNAQLLAGKLSCIAGESATDCVTRRNASAQQMADDPKTSDADITSGKALPRFELSNGQQSLIDKNGGATVVSSSQAEQEKNTDAIWNTAIRNQKVKALATQDPNVSQALRNAETTASQAQAHPDDPVTGGKAKVAQAHLDVAVSQNDAQKARDTTDVPSWVQGLSPDDQAAIVKPVTDANTKLGQAYNAEQDAQDKQAQLENQTKTVQTAKQTAQDAKDKLTQTQHNVDQIDMSHLSTEDQVAVNGDLSSARQTDTKASQNLKDQQTKLDGLSHPDQKPQNQQSPQQNHPSGQDQQQTSQENHSGNQDELNAAQQQQALKDPPPDHSGSQQELDAAQQQQDGQQAAQLQQNAADNKPQPPADATPAATPSNVR
jgi:hypothetical protein